MKEPSEKLEKEIKAKIEEEVVKQRNELGSEGFMKWLIDEFYTLGKAHVKLQDDYVKSRNF